MFRFGVAVATLGAVIVAIVLVFDGSSGVRRPSPARRQPKPTRVSVWVHPGDPGAAVPSRFLGLSFEVSSAEQISRYAERGDFETLLRSLGPGVLRLGGASADTRVAWTDALTPRPSWASGVLDPADLRRLARIAVATGWRVLLTIGLVHYDPLAAAREAAAARAAFGPSLMGIEIGNEPDSYGRHGLRRSSWGDATYNDEVSAYRETIAAVAPGIALAGPGVSGSTAFRSWAPAEVLDQQPTLLTGHHYPLGCHGAEPTIARLLSRATRGRENESLARFMAVARASGIPLRVDETNSVSCGGRAGVSNTFAAALWAVSYIARTMAAGAAGVNLEGNPATCLGYSPLCAPSPARLAAGALSPQPEWYALLLTSGLVGDRPLRSSIVAHGRPDPTVTTLRAPDGGLRFVVVDDDPPGSRALALKLHVGPGYGAASVLALTAPSPGSTSGVRLGGAAVAPDGSWRRPGGLESLAQRAGAVSLTVRASSAALVSVAPLRRRSARPTRTCVRRGCASRSSPRSPAVRRRGRRRG